MCLMESDLAVSIFAGLPNICISEREALPHWYRCMQNRLIEKRNFAKAQRSGGVGHLAGVFPSIFRLDGGPAGPPVTDKHKIQSRYGPPSIKTDILFPVSIEGECRTFSK